MKVTYNKKAKDPTYYIQESYRNKDGKSTTRTVKILGKHSELLKITDDPLAYAHEQAKQMTEHKGIINKSIDFNKKVEYSDESKMKQVGYFYLRYFFDSLKLYNFFTTMGDEDALKICLAVEFQIYNLLFYSNIAHDVKDYFNGPSITFREMIEVNNKVEKYAYDYYDYVAKEVLCLDGKHQKEIHQMMKKYQYVMDPIHLYKMTADLVLKLLKYDLEEHGYLFKEGDLLQPLKVMFVIKQAENNYRAVYSNSRILQALEDIYHLGLDHLYYRKEDLLKKTRKF